MKTRTRIAGMIIQDGKILMVKGKGYNELWTPGGKIESGESDEQCLTRELKEEINVQPTEMKFFKEYSGTSFYNPNKTVTQRIYIVGIDGEPKPGAEIESIVWLSRDDFEKKKFPMITITEKEIIPDLIRQNFF